MAAPDQLQLRVNGKDLAFPAGSTLEDLVAHLGFDRKFLVVEINGDPASWAASAGRALCHGDRIELVRPVAGG